MNEKGRLESGLLFEAGWTGHRPPSGCKRGVRAARVSLRDGCGCGCRRVGGCLLLLGGMVADRAPDGRTGDTMLTGEVAHHATRDSAFAAARAGAACCEHQGCANDGEFAFRIHDISPEVV
jgi:hypothetical protein